MAKPKFKPFERIGNLMVVEHHDTTRVNPRNGRAMADEQHWYKVRCICGSKTFRSQQELREKRRPHLQQCKPCQRAESLTLTERDTFAEMIRNIAAGG